MTARLKYADTASAGRFPLRPGKPLIHRRSNGAWGYSCVCAGHNHPRLKAKATGSARHNCDDWAHALREALEHIAWYHKTPAHYEIEALEAAYALPAVERSSP
ncbi:hypothetical protein ACFQ0G_53915 [Streptomyces chiangmaiensis]|uniref:hypothetical protein n=1 Tax=Streptomyces chiangmaiensis TaxID=766497 RepID=UPI0031E7DB0B